MTKTFPAARISYSWQEVLQNSGPREKCQNVSIQALKIYQALILCTKVPCDNQIQEPGVLIDIVTYGKV